MESRRLFLLDEILEKPLIMSRDKTTRIFGIESTGREMSLKGYVESESRKDSFHRVEVTYLPASMHLASGTCSCEAYQFYGFPCKHMERVRNVYVKNLKRFDNKNEAYSK